ncbi:MAG: ATP-dependent sacrificial sulfur transferase LarE [Synechococcus sp.]|nr:ATP-dependent sacrificial sulfur transferase LarE [Synechococcus sp.]
MPESRCHPQLESLAAAQLEQLQALRALIAAQQRVLVAYSGGVDSTLVAAIAVEQLGERALAVTGVSPALAPHLLEEARWQAAWLGVQHREQPTAELNDPLYASNPQDRCYYCKRELHQLLAQLAASTAAAQVLDGVNLDDLGDHRPGLKAAAERQVLSPLALCNIDKHGVRAISRALGFPWWDKPAQPCLASRFPYGEAISAPRLQRVAQAERWLQQRGYHRVRVRSQGDTARIEIPVEQISTFLQELNREVVVEAFASLGFQAVSLDLEGLISGKLNRALAAD